MTNCQKKGCTRAANFVPVINVPAEGWPIDMHQPIQMVVGCPLCKDHVTEINPEDFLTDQMKRAMTMMTMNRAAPDFSRAFVSKAPMNGKQYKDFLARSKEQKP